MYNFKYKGKMATFQINQSKLIVKYLFNNHGQAWYQRRIPDDLQERIGRKKYNIKLDPSQGQPITLVQRLAKQHDALFKLLRGNPSLTVPEKKLAAMAVLGSYDLKQGDGNIKLGFAENTGWESDDSPHLNKIHSDLEEKQRDGTITEAEKLALIALTKPLPTLLSELPDVYFEHHRGGKGNDPDFRKKSLMRWSKLIEATGDIPAENFTRDHARQFVSYREASGVKSATVQRYLNDIKAIFQVATDERVINYNPFVAITAKNLGQDKVERIPFTNEELQDAVKYCTEHDDEIRRIVLLSILTGARLGEIVGLRRKDCRLNEETPFINLTPYGKRRLKTLNSVREVPLVPLAKKIIQKQFDEFDGAALFPRYCDGIGDKKPNANGASQTINKWIRKSLHIDKTTHCFRHSVVDLLRNANIPKEQREEICGHGRQTMNDTYGVGRGREMKLKMLKKALKPIL